MADLGDELALRSEVEQAAGAESLAGGERVHGRDLEGVRGPVRRKHARTAERGDDARQREPAPELEHAEPVEIQARDRPRERDRRRPQLGPVGEELLVLERLLVEERVGDARPQESKRPLAHADPLVDEVEPLAPCST